MEGSEIKHIIFYLFLNIKTLFSAKEATINLVHLKRGRDRQGDTDRDRLTEKQRQTQREAYTNSNFGNIAQYDRLSNRSVQIWYSELKHILIRTQCLHMHAYCCARSCVPADVTVLSYRPSSDCHVIGQNSNGPG